MTNAYQCTDCGYGAATSAPPPSCPMCASRSWLRAALTVARIGDANYLITPPRNLDAAAGALLAETVAELAYEHPEVVVDLRGVDLIDEPTAMLLLRLGALARCAGGRLLAVCPTGARTHAEIHELDAGDDGLGVLATARAGTRRLLGRQPTAHT